MLTLTVVLINTTPVQNFIAHKATTWLSGKLKTKVAIDHVRVDLLNHLSLHGLYIEDRAHDTLLYAGEATVQLTDWFIFRDKPVLHYLKLDNAYAHLYRNAISSEWNYDFIEKAFATNDTTKSAAGKPIEFDLEKIVLNNVRFHMDDAWGGEDLDFDLGQFTIDADDLNVNKKKLDISSISGNNIVIAINEYKAGRPKRVRPAGYVKPIDITPFNPENWQINAKKIALNECVVKLTADKNVPQPGLFDEDHLFIDHINCLVTNASIKGDTVRGNAEHLTAHERCGITIKDLHSKVTVSPIASICEDLYLETNYSKIRDYYAMHYKRFPNFLDYIDSVVMVGHMRNSTIDTRDIEYFAPEMKNIPAIVTASGDGRGTVANLSADHLVVTDGRNVVRGALTMKGLPDIYKTYITFSNAEVYTNGEGILKYAPDLATSPNLTLKQLTHAYFKGSYAGYIDNFAVNGIVISNLGAFSTNMKMAIPNFASKSATYSGTFASDKLELGLLLNIPKLGSVTCSQSISGRSFDPEDIQVNVNGTVNELNLNGYAYHNITTQGLLGKKQFNGQLLIDDPKLAMEFDGGLDYNDIKNIKLNATAHLLYSDLKALNITGDQISSSADFDLNCTGSNIDNFSGYARLYNLDVRRNAHKMDIDSIYLNSVTGADGYRELSLTSNVATANVKGKFLLSGLQRSAQYYLFKYIPNYIDAPLQYPPDQDLEFSITTRNIDSLLAVAANNVSGFDSATISGSFNTTAQKLVLNANIPSGTIGRFHMSDIAINGQGNLDNLALTTNIDNVAIGDSLINSSLSLTATLANDSLNFTVATVVPDTSSSITLNGHVVARKDSLFLSILPSEFFLNRTRWDIAGGSKIVYSDKFLQVDGIKLTSGLQQITANTILLPDDQRLVVNTENLDLAQLGYWMGLSPYQPDGRVNGSITIEKMFQQFYIGANIKATDVKFGSDTVGTINLIGTYLGARKLISLDPQTGIYRGNSSIVASGNISYDSMSNQKLDGTISFINADVAWATPFLTGIFSRLGGKVNGNILFRGTSYDPQLDGTLFLTNAGMKVDYMGCYYSIPAATVRVDNHRISFGRVEAYDIYNNPAIVTGYFSHNLFYDMQMHFTVRSPKLEVVRLNASENEMFYGNVIAGMDSFTVRGTFNHIKLHAFNVYPAEKSHLFIPVTSSATLGTYSFVSFKNYGKNQTPYKRANRFKLDLGIEANLNDLAQMTIVLDPAAGDAITAKGEGSLQLNMPSGDDLRITGTYVINEGTYDFTFKNLEYRRQFQLNPNSSITFTGPFFDTKMNVDATYSKKARLYDLLNESETSPSANLMTDAERSDAKAPQTVNVILHMRGTLDYPQLTFGLDLPEKRFIGSYAQTKFNRINQDDRQKLEQVGSLLLIGSFIPSDGLSTGGVANNVTFNNIGQLASGWGSTQLTSLVQTLLKDDKLNVDVKYNNYNYTDPAGSATSYSSRNVVKVGISHQFLNDRLQIQVGSTSDWGRPASSNTTASGFNITGDFRIQYLLSQANGLRLNAFRTSDYDVIQDKDITRGGAGLSWRKSFDSFSDLFVSNKQLEKIREEQRKKQLEFNDSASKTDAVRIKE